MVAAKLFIHSDFVESPNIDAVTITVTFLEYEYMKLKNNSLQSYSSPFLVLNRCLKTCKEIHKPASHKA